MLHSFRLICLSISRHILGPQEWEVDGGQAEAGAKPGTLRKELAGLGRRLYNVVSILFMTLLRLLSLRKSAGRRRWEKS